MAPPAQSTKERLLQDLAGMRMRRQREQAAGVVRAEVLSMNAPEDLKNVVVTMHQSMLDLGIETPLTHVEFGPSPDAPEFAYVVGNASLQPDPSHPSAPQDAPVVWDGSPYRHTYLQGPDIVAETLTAENAAPLGIAALEGRQKELLQGPWEVTRIPFQHGTVSFRERQFHEPHLDLVQELADAVSLGYLRFLDLQERDRARRRLILELKKELQTAHQMQMDLMPDHAPRIPHFDMAGRCVPAADVGGDFFQYFTLSHHRLAIAIADVTGHAMEAAIPVVMFSGMLKSETDHGNPLDQLFGHLNLSQLFNNLNQTLCESWGKRTFVCFLMGELDVFSRTFRFANSGFPFPYHYRAATGTVYEVETQTAYPLGIRPNTVYQEREIQLQPGDRLVFCSDGIIEAGNPAEDFFGFDRTAAAIEDGCRQNLPVTDLLDHIFSSVDAFAAGYSQEDDRTCLVLHASGTRNPSVG